MAHLVLRIFPISSISSPQTQPKWEKKRIFQEFWAQTFNCFIFVQSQAKHILVFNTFYLTFPEITPEMS